MGEAVVQAQRACRHLQGAEALVPSKRCVYLHVAHLQVSQSKASVGHGLRKPTNKALHTLRAREFRCRGT